jgi:hypothetical protein
MCSGLVSKPGFGGEKPATNHRSRTCPFPFVLAPGFHTLFLMITVIWDKTYSLLMISRLSDIRRYLLSLTRLRYSRWWHWRCTTNSTALTPVRLFTYSPYIPLKVYQLSTKTPFVCIIVDKSVRYVDTLLPDCAASHLLRQYASFLWFVGIPKLNLHSAINVAGL